MSGLAGLKESYELAVVGAGPAGLAAATLAAELGIDTLLIDEQDGPGGQVYRAIARPPLGEPAILGADYWQGAALLVPFRASGAAYLPGAAVWSVSRALEIGVSAGGTARLIQAKHVILATGALERPFPIPGWTLPGVMTAGAAQILLKSSGLVAEGENRAGRERPAPLARGRPVFARRCRHRGSPRHHPACQPERCPAAFSGLPRLLLFRQGDRPHARGQTPGASGAPRDRPRRRGPRPARDRGLSPGRTAASGTCRPTCCCCIRG